MELDPKVMRQAAEKAAILAVKPYWSITETALMLGISRRTVDRHLASGRLKGYKLDPKKRKLVLIREEIDLAVRAGRVIPVGPFDE